MNYKKIPKRKKEYFNHVLSSLSEILGIEKENIIGSSRKTHFVEARRILIYYICKDSKYYFSLKEIAFLVNYLDHATVIHHRDNFEVFFNHRDQKSREAVETYKELKIKLKNESIKKSDNLGNCYACLYYTGSDSLLGPR